MMLLRDFGPHGILRDGFPQAENGTLHNNAS